MASQGGGVPSTMVVGGKTFNLSALISESVLDTQMANVFKVLKKLSSLIETQATQIQALQTKVRTSPRVRRAGQALASLSSRRVRAQTKLTLPLWQVLEIDPLAQRISSMHAWQEQTADRLNRIEEKQMNEAKALVAVTERVTELEGRFAVIGQVQKEMKATNDHMAQVTSNFDQLKIEARDALTLSADVKHFKMELQELQEDVTTVLNQAPATERLMAQVQQNVEASAEQLMTMTSKTSFMEANMTKMR
jgi:predicted  nucleic acid-binding Zn-ribbon protein